MNQGVKRILNAFLIGTLAAGLMLLLEDWQNMIEAVRVGNWASLGTLGLSIVGGAILAGLRALQAYVPFVPSPEPEENPTALGGTGGKAP